MLNYLINLWPKSMFEHYKGTSGSESADRALASKAENAYYLDLAFLWRGHQKVPM